MKRNLQTGEQNQGDEMVIRPDLEGVALPSAMGAAGRGGRREEEKLSIRVISMFEYQLEDAYNIC